MRATTGMVEYHSCLRSTCVDGKRIGDGAAAGGDRDAGRRKGTGHVRGQSSAGEVHGAG